MSSTLAIILMMAIGSIEACAGVTFTDPSDVCAGSCGVLIPGFGAKLVDLDGKEITGYDQPGELLLQSPSIFLGYQNNDQADLETFVDGWMRTGDEVAIRRSPSGPEHLFVIHRI